MALIVVTKNIVDKIKHFSINIPEEKLVDLSDVRINLKTKN